ncbi:unnamed protein product [Tuber aestivum]|uniref:Uncharacterized protein n=1 Tax=Tuber aestivum TaxID=59557 RepID=A0A292PW02_9PEZI|nr:unnamed protein product [Tuber aestivum]
MPPIAAPGPVGPCAVTNVVLRSNLGPGVAAATNSKPARTESKDIVLFIQCEEKSINTSHILPQHPFAIGSSLPRSDQEPPSKPILIEVLLKTLPIIALFLTLTHAVALANPFTEPDTNDLEKRACDNDGCKCDPSYSAGLYCGHCLAVKSCQSGACLDNVYQCGRGGKCCNYGVRTSCKNDNGPGC